MSFHRLAFEHFFTCVNFSETFLHKSALAFHLGPLQENTIQHNWHFQEPLTFPLHFRFFSFFIFGIEKNIDTTPYILDVFLSPVLLSHPGFACSLVKLFNLLYILPHVDCKSTLYIPLQSYDLLSTVQCTGLSWLDHRVYGKASFGMCLHHCFWVRHLHWWWREILFFSMWVAFIQSFAISTLVPCVRTWSYTRICTIAYPDFQTFRHRLGQSALYPTHGQI